MSLFSQLTIHFTTLNFSETAPTYLRHILCFPSCPSSLYIITHLFEMPPPLGIPPWCPHPTHQSNGSASFTILRHVSSLHHTVFIFLVSWQMSRTACECKGTTRKSKQDDTLFAFEIVLRCDDLPIKWIDGSSIVVSAGSSTSAVLCVMRVRVFET
jgi:hypothetical protein